MKPKHFLQQAYYADRQININLLKLESMRASLYGHGVNYQDRKIENKSENSVENAILKVIEFERQINKDIDKLVDKKREIEKVIDTVTDIKRREILVRRYLNFQKWAVIADEMEMDLRWIYRLHNKTLDKLRLTIESH